MLSFGVSSFVCDAARCGFLFPHMVVRVQFDALGVQLHSLLVVLGDEGGVSAALDLIWERWENDGLVSRGERFTDRRRSFVT